MISEPERYRKAFRYRSERPNTEMIAMERYMKRYKNEPKLDRLSILPRLDEMTADPSPIGALDSQNFT